MLFVGDWISYKTNAGWPRATRGHINAKSGWYIGELKPSIQKTAWKYNSRWKLLSTVMKFFIYVLRLEELFNNNYSSSAPLLRGINSFNLDIVQNF